MASSALTRPFHPGITIDGWGAFWQALNKVWWLQRLPMFLLAVPASYGVGAYAHERYPLVIAMIAGAGFEAAYMGAIAFADQQLDDDWISWGLWWLLNLGAVVSSALINVLFSAGGTFATITWEDAVHGAPLAVLNFLYALLLHRNTSKALAAERVAAALAQAKAERDEEERKAEELRTRYKCLHCGEGYPTPQARNGHRRTCKGS